MVGCSTSLVDSSLLPSSLPQDSSSLSLAHTSPARAGWQQQQQGPEDVDVVGHLPSWATGGQLQVEVASMVAGSTGAAQQQLLVQEVGLQARLACCKAATVAWLPAAVMAPNIAAESTMASR